MTKSELIEELAQLKKLKRAQEYIANVQMLVNEAYKLAQQDNINTPKSATDLENSAKIFCLLELANMYLKTIVMEI